MVAGVSLPCILEETFLRPTRASPYLKYRMTRMPTTQDQGTPERQEMRKQFQDFTRIMAAKFPSEELRFNWKCGGSTVRLLLPNHANAVREFDLADDPQHLVHEAMFAIKEIIRAFDA